MYSNLTRNPLQQFSAASRTRTVVGKGIQNIMRGLIIERLVLIMVVKCMFLTMSVVTLCDTANVKFTNPSVLAGKDSGQIRAEVSASQLDAKSTVKTLFITGSNTLGSVAESLIKDRYNCSGYTMAFAMPDPDSPKTLMLTVTLTGILASVPSCTVFWGDGSSIPVYALQNPGATSAVLLHTYAKLGVYDVQMSYVELSSTQWCPQRQTNCVETDNLLDDFYRLFRQPLKFFSNEPILLNSYMKLKEHSCVPEIKWLATYVSGSTFTPYTDFIQSNTSVLRLEKDTVDPGEYVISLEVKFPSEGQTGWVTDSMVIKVVLPELVTHIHGGELRDVPRGGIVYIDASISTDPSDNLTSVSALPLIARWQFGHYYNNRWPNGNMWKLMKDFPDKDPLWFYQTYVITPGSDNALEVDTTRFTAKTMALVMFTMTRGTRKSTAMQMIRFVPNAVPVTLDCVYNCQIGHRMFNKDKIQVDAVVAESVDVTTLNFKWTVHYWRTFFFGLIQFYVDKDVQAPTGYNTRSFAVTRGSIYQGEDIKISLKITGGGYATTWLHFVRTVNRLPYSGTCVLDKYIVQSAREWLTLTCNGWHGNDFRKYKDSGKDYNPMLTYNVRQYTNGAFVEEEPILNTRYRQSHLILKVGQPDTFATILNVQIFDVFKNNFSVTLHVTSNPAFNFASVGPNENGADLIRQYTEVDYPFDQVQLANMGKSDLIISLVAAVCSNIHLLDLPIWLPPVPRVLNTDGAVLDLTPSGNTDVGTLDNVIEEAENETIDPATLAVQEVTQNMTAGIRKVVEEDLLNRRNGDRYLASIIANAFTNLGSLEKFINLETRQDLVFLSEVVGLAALNVPDKNTIEDLSAQVETTSGEIFNMARAVVNSVVPDNLREIRRVENFLAGRAQIEQMLSIIGGNMSLKTTSLSSEERAYLYMRMQKSLALKNTDKKALGLEFNENVFMYDEDGISSFITSNVLRIDVKALDTRVTPSYITFDQSVETPNATLIDPMETYDADDVSEFSYHKFLYGKNTDAVCLIIQPVGEYNFTEYKVYFRFQDPPSILVYDFEITVRELDDWKYCIYPMQMNGHSGTTYFAVDVKGYVKGTKYNQTLITVGCVTWDEQQEKWQTDKCHLEWVPQYNKITCFCRNITDMIFANSFFVAPNSIDFSTVFLKFSPLSQAAVMGSIGGILVIYVIAILLLVGLDRRDQLKWGITPLRDNYVTDQQYYLIKVYTGMRRGAGTRSRVAFILTGSNGETGPRELFDGVRKEFSTGSVMTFFMATTKHLGHLEHMYIWHDNSGDEDFASWYLNQVVVYDIENKDAYTFSAERWLSVDSTVDANIVSTGSNNNVKFESRFFSQTRDKLSESHMWVSILYRPSLSTFTRVQRASCALVFIFLNMIANAMYFNPNPDYETEALIQVGPFRFTSQQIFVSIICALITTPPVMLLIFFFKRTKRRPRSSCSSCCKCVCACCAGSLCCRSKDIAERRQYEEMVRSKLLSDEVPDFSGGLYLPWWFIIFAWFMVIAGTVVPAFFILLYSMEWGKQKSEEWLTTFMMSLLESMLFVDPIMVVCFAFVLACLVRSSKNDTNIDMSVVVQNYQQSIGLHQNNVSSSILLLKRLKDEYRSYVSMPRFISPPLQGEGLNKAARDHQHHTQLLKVFRDILFNLFFMFIIFSICYGSRDDRSYAHHEDMVNQIVTPTKLPHFKHIKTPGDMFNWINVTVIPNLFIENDINGNPLHWYYKQFTMGYNFFRFDPPRLRQMRTPKGTCKIPYMGTVDCYGEYSVRGEVEEDYCIGWTPRPCSPTEDVYNVSGDSWTFTSAFDIWGLPTPALYTTYGGGGYIAQFDVSRTVSDEIVDELYRNLWIDRQTRAVFFEFTLYAPATNMFIYNVFIVEFPQTGGAFTTYSIYPIRLYSHVGPMGSFTLLCEVIFVIYMVILVVKICIRIYQLRCKFFTMFWQVYELLMLLVGVAAIAMYAFKLGMTYLTIKKYQEDIKIFVNFAHLVFWDQMLVTFLAVLVFMATLRILEVFASSKKVIAIVKIFQQCGTDLFWYGTCFLHILFGFCFLGHFLFGKQLIQYMDILECLTTLSLALIGKSTYSDITATQPILAQVFYIFYVLTVIFFTLTIFFSILGASIDDVMHDTLEDQREDLVEHIMKKFRSLFTKPDAKNSSDPANDENLIPDSSFKCIFYEAPKPFEMVSLGTSNEPPESQDHKALKRGYIEKLLNSSKLYRKRASRKVEPLASES